MSGRTTVVVLSAWALTLSSLARADALELPVNIGDGPLLSSLKSLERQTGIELLYDGNVVREFRSPPVAGKLDAETALQQMLSETDLTVRRASSGAWIIERRETPPLAQQDAAVAEILVVGRRTQNADIRRSEEDVQPYVVATQAEIIRAHRDNIDQFFTSRITANTTFIPSQASRSAGTMSNIDLRGLGSENTLVLVDGRRMPDIPLSYTGFRQSDVNAIPLHAIERIEVLTGSAGGIHGFGALGGVVNVVLDRDPDGFDMHLTQGISSRSDARRYDMEARFGRSFGDGATDVMLFAARSESETVRVGDRGYAVRDRRRTFETAPQYYGALFPYGNSLSVRSYFRINEETGELIANPDLTFKPEFGGAPLESNITFLPVGFAGSTAELVSALHENAGQLDFSIPESEARRDLGSNPRSSALLANIRHRFSERWEAYADAIVLRSSGESYGSSAFNSLPQGSALIAPESPANPFTDYIIVDFPIEGLDEQTNRRVENTRYTAGVEAQLPFDWRGTAEASWGTFHHDVTGSVEGNLRASTLFLVGDPSDPDIDPLGDWEGLQRAVGGADLSISQAYGNQTRLHAQSLRLAGPVFKTAAGPATLTLLAERRSEDVPGYEEVVIRESDGTATTVENPVAARSTTTSSYYAELRSQLFGEDAAPPIRELELQLAVRRDEQHDEFNRDARDLGSDLIRSNFTGTAYTAGARISPASWLMLRGSYSTGKQPPSLNTLVESAPLTRTFSMNVDPKRGDTNLGTEGSYLIRLGGNAGLKTVRASTVFLGAVLTPTGRDGPTFAIDYSRIRRERDIQTFSEADIVANEDYWPDRVVRAPLSDTDRANGFTAGRIMMVDMRYANLASLEVDSYDLRADWPMSLLGGRLRIYADATYHKRNVLKQLFQPDVVWSDYREGPLKRRANGGFDWSTEHLTLGANLQYFGSSSVIQLGGALVGAEDLIVEIQGSRRIPSQSYLDLTASWRIPFSDAGATDGVTVDFGVINVLDKAPPRESVAINLTLPGYSRYGDARQRRFELGLSLHF
jgi:outer membrane receptor protein involved in Fe transport